MAILKPDLEQAALFLRLLGKDKEVCTFQTFDDDEERRLTGQQRKGLARIYNGSLSEHSTTLRNLNQAGAGVFVTINRTDGAGRKIGNVVEVKAVFADTDGAPLEPIRENIAPPHLVVQSSPGNYHTYWLVKNVPLERFPLLQHAIHVRFKTCKDVCDLPRVMRLPGFYHRKDEKNAHLVSIHDGYDEHAALYEESDLVRGLPLELRALEVMRPRVEPTLNGVPEGQRDNEIFRFACSMKARGFKRDDVERMVKAKAADCTPPFPEKEALRKVEQAFKYADEAECNDEETDPSENPKPKRKQKKEKPTHDALAQKVLGEINPANIIHHKGLFWMWGPKPGVWSPVEDDTVRQKIRETLVEGEAARKSEMEGTLHFIRILTHRADDPFDKHRDIINCKNGELHYSHTDHCFQLRPHCREHYFTTQVPVPYLSESAAPRFTDFLLEVFAGDEDRLQKAKLVQELMGYSVTCSTKFEKFVLLIGSGANGKSKILDVVEALCGKEHVTGVQPADFGATFQRARLHNKLVNIVTELREGIEIDDAVLKAVTSGELFTVSHKYGPTFEFHPYATCWFGTNHMPRSRDFSDALFRRAIVLEFNNKFEGENEDPNLKEKLLAELPGIFVMALDAYAEVLRRGWFTKTASNEAAKQAWRTETDQAAQFIEEKCILAPGIETASKDLYDTYKEWSIEAGIHHMLNRKNFTLRLLRHGVKLKKGTRGVRKLVGIAVDATPHQ